MKRKTGSPGVHAYYDALRRIFELESGILTAALPHAGERGRNDEDRFRSFLGKVLPRRFSIGSGFLVCSDSSVMPSRQMDVVIYDEIYNSPLHRELAAYVFPVEMVYATVEVKGLLAPGDLVPILQSIADVRRLAREKYYVYYGDTPIGEGKADQRVVSKGEMVSKLPPRAFLFAYDATWRRHSSFVKAIESALAKVPDAHIHGVVVLAREWFACQVPYSNGPKVKHYSDNGLLRFVKHMIHTVASVEIRQMSIDRYLNIEAPSNTSLSKAFKSRRGRQKTHK
ncbi:MAG: hypothetical protein K2Y31_15655 [Burkholderiales bacterium]|jgi:hypothetical protein|nr:hypothetical protein [Burkholderiales bacterium]